jgi:hypothetical protein
MDAQRTPAKQRRSSDAAAASSVRRCFAGLTWKGAALIALLCILHAARRTIQNAIGEVSLVDWLLQLAYMTATGLIVAIPIALAVVATCNVVPRDRGWRYPLLALAIVVSSTAGVALQLFVESRGTFGFHKLGENLNTMTVFFQAWLRYALLGALFTAVFVYLRVAEESDARARQAEVDRARFDQHMDEARLAVLQAQIEPHFLFNTLATVRRLYRTSPDVAVGMLDDLMRYLAVAVPQMRASDCTLGREATLAESYLSIQRMRMGRRLRFDIDIAEPLRSAHVPPMMLLTLAENAVRHGLNPLPQGGFIRISANVHSDQLELEVADSGQGFTRSSGVGTGLANIRARLGALYGARGRLDIRANRPHGITATIALPFAPSPEASRT